MGKLIEGKWYSDYDTTKTSKKFQREDSKFRNWGSSSADSHYPVESGRYHLYVSYACPWAHGALIFRKLKQLEDHISVSVVHPFMLENGWEFRTDFPDATGDQLYNSNFLYEIYQKSKPDYTGKVTVPVLWDKQQESVVSNESLDIIKMFDQEFDSLTGNTESFYPDNIKAEMDELNEEIYHNVNNGVYKTGFASDQNIYEQECHNLFAMLDKLENKLNKPEKYLFGDNLTLPDIRLFATLIRFDLVYYSHFKCNLKRIKEYPRLNRYLKDIYNYPGIKDTINFEHIKSHYFYSHESINPKRIIPAGPKEIFN
jgi:putative glutathione S-transferase